MATFQITGPDGKKYRVTGDNAEGALAALQQQLGAIAPIEENPQDGLPYGQPPEGMVLNPQTGQMEDLRSSANPTIPDMGGVNSAALGIGQGAGFNLLDEAAAGLSAATGGDYGYDLARMREAERRASGDHPVAYYGGQIGGAVGGALGLAKGGLSLTANAIKRGANLGRVAAASAAEGSLLGAAHGAGSGEGVGDRAVKGGIGGLIGAGIGAATPFALAGVQKLAGMAAAPIMARLRPESYSQRAIGEALRRSGMTIDDIASSLSRSQADDQGMFTVADAMGNSGQRMLSTVARNPSDARQGVIEALQARQVGQGDRLSSFLAEGFDATDTAAQRAARLAAERRATAAANYSAAREGAGNVDPTAAISAADEFLGMGTTLPRTGIADDSIESAVSRARSYLTDGESVLTDFNAALRSKQEIDAMIEGAKPAVQRQLIPIRDALDDSLEAASPAYANARDVFRKQSQAIDAIETGKDAASGRMRSADTTGRFSRMTPEEQSGFRAGYVDPLIARIESTSMSPSTNKARPLISSKTGEEFPAFALPDKAEQMGTRIAREQRMFETSNAALGGSKTADNLADAAEMAKFDPGVMSKLLRGDMVGAVADGARRLVTEASGTPPRVIEQIAEALMETTPDGARKFLSQGAARTSQADRLRARLISSLLGLEASGAGNLPSP